MKTLLVFGRNSALGHLLEAMSKGMEDGELTVDIGGWEIRLSDVDACDPTAVARELVYARPTAVLNCASTSRVNACERLPWLGAESVAAAWTVASQVAKAFSPRCPVLHIGSLYELGDRMSAYAWARKLASAAVLSLGGTVWRVDSLYDYPEELATAHGLNRGWIDYLERYVRLGKPTTVQVAPVVCAPTSYPELAGNIWAWATGAYKSARERNCGEYGRQMMRREYVRDRWSYHEKRIIEAAQGGAAPRPRAFLCRLEAI